MILDIFALFTGKLCDASARYEKAIQEEPNEIGHHKVRHVCACVVEYLLSTAWYLFLCGEFIIHLLIRTDYCENFVRVGFNNTTGQVIVISCANVPCFLFFLYVVFDTKTALECAFLPTRL